MSPYVTTPHHLSTTGSPWRLGTSIRARGGAARWHHALSPPLWCPPRLCCHSHPAPEAPPHCSTAARPPGGATDEATERTPPFPPPPHFRLLSPPRCVSLPPPVPTNRPLLKSDPLLEGNTRWGHRDRDTPGWGEAQVKNIDVRKRAKMGSFAPPPPPPFTPPYLPSPPRPPVRLGPLPMAKGEDARQGATQGPHRGPSFTTKVLSVWSPQGHPPLPPPQGRTVPPLLPLGTGRAHPGDTEREGM